MAIPSSLPTVLGATSLSISLIALTLSSTTLLTFRKQVELLDAQVGASGIRSLVRQEDFQKTQSRVESLNNGLWETKQNLAALQERVTESQKSIQSLQDQIIFYKSQVRDLEADKQVLASCIETITPVAAEMSVIPASLSNGDGVFNWIVSRGVGAWDALEAVQNFNGIWNSGTESCEMARSIAVN